ncbi:MAG: hypothetical protein U1E17_13000 [Geminicoccaceae bacterium]
MKAAGPSVLEPDLIRHRLPLYLLGRRHLPLAFAHAWWQGARQPPGLPPRMALDTAAFRLLLPHARWLAAARQPSWLVQALETAAPLLHELRPAHGRHPALGRELLLPVAEDGWRVDFILQVVQRRAGPGA